jgi:hypothetical protein
MSSLLSERRCTSIVVDVASNCAVCNAHGCVHTKCVTKKGVSTTDIRVTNSLDENPPSVCVSIISLRQAHAIVSYSNALCTHHIFLLKSQCLDFRRCRCVTCRPGDQVGNLKRRRELMRRSLSLKYRFHSISKFIFIIPLLLFYITMICPLFPPPPPLSLSLGLSCWAMGRAEKFLAAIFPSLGEQRRPSSWCTYGRV